MLALSSFHDAGEILTTRGLQDQKSNNPRMKLMYDVHLPNARFKKSNPGLPAFSLCTTRSSDPIPLRSYSPALWTVIHICLSI